MLLCICLFCENLRIEDHASVTLIRVPWNQIIFFYIKGHLGKVCTTSQGTPFAVLLDKQYEVSSLSIPAVCSVIY